MAAWGLESDIGWRSWVVWGYCDCEVEEAAFIFTLEIISIARWMGCIPSYAVSSGPRSTALKLKRSSSLTGSRLTTADDGSRLYASSSLMSRLEAIAIDPYFPKLSEGVDEVGAANNGERCTTEACPSEKPKVRRTSHSCGHTFATRVHLGQHVFIFCDLSNTNRKANRLNSAVYLGRLVSLVLLSLILSTIHNGRFRTLAPILATYGLEI